MQIKLTLNGRTVERDIMPDTMLLEFLRDNGCYSVKRGCETSNCGLCTVLVEGKSVLSCTYLAMRVNGKTVTTMEGLQERAAEFGAFMADQGVEQCGFCSPGFIINVLAMVEDLKNPTDAEILEYLSGNLCRCSGYEGQLRAIKAFLKTKGEGK